MGTEHEEMLKKSLMFDMLVEMILKKATLSTYNEDSLVFHKLDDICEILIPKEMYEAKVKKLKGENNE